MSSREIVVDESRHKLRNYGAIAAAIATFASGAFQCEIATISSRSELYTPAFIMFLASGLWTTTWVVSNRRVIGERLPKINFFARPQTLSRENPAQGMARGYFAAPDLGQDPDRR